MQQRRVTPFNNELEFSGSGYQALTVSLKYHFYRHDTDDAPFRTGRCEVGSGHPPDTVVAMALAYHAFKAGRQPGDDGVTI